MARIPNYKIDKELEKLATFENYNGTIVANRGDSNYVVFHWNTKILDFNFETNQIVHFTTGHISQTTSTLVGRILRSLPQEVVVEFARGFSNRKEQYRILKMARLIWKWARRTPPNVAGFLFDQKLQLAWRPELVDRSKHEKELFVRSCM